MNPEEYDEQNPGITMGQEVHPPYNPQGYMPGGMSHPTQRGGGYNQYVPPQNNPQQQMSQPMPQQMPVGQPGQDPANYEPRQHQPQQQPWGMAGDMIGGMMSGNSGGEALGKMGLQYGTNLLGVGQERLKGYFGDGNVKEYFNVSNGFVFTKLKILMFPFIHKNWKRRQLGEGEDAKMMSPRDDDNAPDLYIPLMSFVSYVLLTAVVIGTSEEGFHPSVLGATFSTGLGILLLEVFGIKLGMYLLDVFGASLFDIVAHAGYKYVGICISVGMGLLLGRTMYYVSVSFFSICMFYFVLKTLRLVVLPDISTVGAHHVHHTRKYYFLIGIALIQFPLALIIGPGNLIH